MDINDEFVKRIEHLERRERVGSESRALIMDRYSGMMVRVKALEESKSFMMKCEMNDRKRMIAIERSLSALEKELNELKYLNGDTVERADEADRHIFHAGGLEPIQVDGTGCVGQLEKACFHCGGEGVVDSGGQNPDGSWIEIPCLCQEEKTLCKWCGKEIVFRKTEEYWLHDETGNQECEGVFATPASGEGE